MFKVNLFDSKTCTLIGIGTNLSSMVLKLLAGIFGDYCRLFCCPDNTRDGGIHRRLTMEQSHQIASAVRGQLLQKVRHVHDVMVHVNPHRPDQALEGGGCDRER
ncbi:hypothetical protein M1O53_04040 [Dehalococcoidia bacterium]|nr:hypothetical protein [Dehalococcoidia bacterium]